jgi:outer membrane protein OmpA-like peptidoglycan-associated protein
MNEPRKPLVCSYNIRVPGYAQRTGKRLFLQPSFFEHGESALFPNADRKYDVYFHYPWSENDDIEFELPSGYALDNAERPQGFNASGVIEYNVEMGVTKDQRTLIMKRKFFFGGGETVVLPVSSYSQLKAVFDRLQKSDEHTITLKQGPAN